MNDRIVPSRFALTKTKKSQEIGEKWKARVRWILLVHKDPDALMMERFFTNAGRADCDACLPDHRKHEARSPTSRQSLCFERPWTTGDRPGR